MQHELKTLRAYVEELDALQSEYATRNAAAFTAHDEACKQAGCEVAFSPELAATARIVIVLGQHPHTVKGIDAIRFSIRTTRDTIRTLIYLALSGVYTVYPVDHYRQMEVIYTDFLMRIGDYDRLA